VGVAGVSIAGVWLVARRDLAWHLGASLGVAMVFALALWGSSQLRAVWDVSENRRNSFPVADEAALRQIREPLRVTVFLAAEDPRRMDLERNVLSKLVRLLPRVEIDYASQSRTGLFQAPGDHYGEVWYELGDRRVMSRSATEPIVLDTLYHLAQVPPPARAEGSDYPGHPLAARPSGAAWIYYAAWPLVVGLLCWYHFRIRS
jgi:ABC-2 type transport system permease protein